MPVAVHQLLANIGANHMRDVAHRVVAIKKRAIWAAATRQLNNADDDETMSEEDRCRKRRRVLRQVRKQIKSASAVAIFPRVKRCAQAAMEEILGDSVDKLVADSVAVTRACRKRVVRMRDVQFVVNREHAVGSYDGWIADQAAILPHGGKKRTKSSAVTEKDEKTDDRTSKKVKSPAKDKNGAASRDVKAKPATENEDSDKKESRGDSDTEDAGYTDSDDDGGAIGAANK